MFLLKLKTIRIPVEAIREMLGATVGCSLEVHGHDFVMQFDG